MIYILMQIRLGGKPGCSEQQEKAAKSYRGNRFSGVPATLKDTTVHIQRLLPLQNHNFSKCVI